MEDASIYEVELGDGNSLFAVFDGHGGEISDIQVIRSANSYRPSLSNNSWVSTHTNLQNTVMLWLKLLSSWISILIARPEGNNLMKREARTTMSMFQVILDVPPMWF